MSVLERIRSANPVPDDTQLLDGPGEMDAFILSVKENSGLVSGGERAPVRLLSEEDRSGKGVGLSKPRHRGWLTAAAVAAGVIVLLGVIPALIGGSTPDGDTAIPTNVDEVALVDSAYEALNAGDIDAWLEHFTDDAVIFGGSKELVADLYAVLLAAGYQADVIESCRLTEAAPTGDAQVKCTVRESNDFHAAGGITLTREELFVVDQRGQIIEANAKVIEFTQPGYYVFNKAFFDWLRDAHPAVHAEIRPVIVTHLPRDPEHMRTALKYVDEFIAQSEVYPVSSNG